MLISLTIIKLIAMKYKNINAGDFTMIKMLKPKVLGASVIGAAVGFTANYAVTKIMFKPKQTIDFAGKQITVNGILPSMQPKVANLVEDSINAVLKNPDLLASVQKAFIKPEIKNEIVDIIIKFIYETADKKSINELISIFLKEEQKDVVVEYTKDLITKVLIDKTDKEYLGRVLTQEGIKIFKEATNNSLMSKMMNERIFASIAKAISVAVHKFVETRATQVILDIVFSEMDNVMDLTVPQLLKELSLDESEMRRLVDIIYDAVVLEIVPEVLENIDFGDAAKSGINKIDFEKIDNFINEKFQKLSLKTSAFGAIVSGVTTNIIASKVLLK